MDLATRKKISKTMKGHSNFEGHHHTHADKLQIGFSQEGHKNAKGLHWSINRNTGQETRTKTKLPQGNKWGRTKAFTRWIHGKKKTNEATIATGDMPAQKKLKSFKAWKDCK